MAQLFTFHSPEIPHSTVFGGEGGVTSQAAANPKEPEMAMECYGSIPIHTIFRGMNILPAILMFTRGVGF